MGQEVHPKAKAQALLEAPPPKAPDKAAGCGWGREERISSLGEILMVTRKCSINANYSPKPG